MHRAIIAVGQMAPRSAHDHGSGDGVALIGVVLFVAVPAVAMLRTGAVAGGQRIK